MLLYFQGELKAQCSPKPRASVATPWVSRIGAVTPCKGKSTETYHEQTEHYRISYMIV